MLTIISKNKFQQQNYAFGISQLHYPDVDKSADQTRINRERTMARELPVEIKTDKSDDESGPALQGRCVLCKRNTRLKGQKCGVKLYHDKETVCFDVYHKNL